MHVLYIYIRICIRICICICINVHMYMYMYMYICIYVYMYMYVYIYILIVYFSELFITYFFRRAGYYNDYPQPEGHAQQAATVWGVYHQPTSYFNRDNKIEQR